MKFGCLGIVVAIVTAAAVAVGHAEANAAAPVRADECVGRQRRCSPPLSSSIYQQRGGDGREGQCNDQDANESRPSSARPAASTQNSHDGGISIVPNRKLPPVIAGASLKAFQAVHQESVFSSSSSLSPSSSSYHHPPTSNSSSSTSSSQSSPPISYSYSSTLPTSDDITTAATTTSAAVPRPTPDGHGHVSLPQLRPPNHNDDDDYSYKTFLPKHYRLGIRRGGEEVVVPTQTQNTVDLAMRSAQWEEAKNRTVAATALLALLSFLSYYFKEDGLIMFSVLLQIIMFQESSYIVGGDLRASSSSPSSSVMTNGQLNKWWWFVTMVLLVDGPRLFPWMANKFGAVAYGMVVLNIMSAVTKFQLSGAKTVAFREYIRQSAVSLLCLSFVVVPSSYWIGVFEEYGQKWLLLPAVLSIFDDLIAFLVGMVSGKPTPSSSSIAPKKTWQGYTVGAIMTMGATWLALDEKFGLKYLPKIAEICPYSQMDGLVLAAVASIIAPFGGSISSLVKRAYGHKKFGTIFGGRIGGLIDLLDGQLMMAPFIYFFLSLYKFRNGSSAS